MRLTVLCWQCSSGRNDSSVPLSPRDSCEGVAKSLFGIDWRSLKCVFEGPRTSCQRAQYLFGPREFTSPTSRAFLTCDSAWVWHLNPFSSLHCFSQICTFLSTAPWLLQTESLPDSTWTRVSNHRAWRQEAEAYHRKRCRPLDLSLLFRYFVLPTSALGIL